MPVIEYSGVEIKLDDEGYLANFNDWTDRVACGIAENEGIEELSKDRLEIIRFMREYYINYKAFPILGAVCRNVHKPDDCVNEAFIDPLKAWKIAGLPKPSEEVVSNLNR